MLRRALALLAVLAIALGGPGPAALAQVLTPVGSGSAATPVVSGTPAVGSVLTVPAYSGVTDQWLRNGSAIGGATSTSYTVVSADQGTTVTAALTLAGLAVPASTALLSSINVTFPATTTDSGCWSGQWASGTPALNNPDGGSPTTVAITRGGFDTAAGAHNYAVNLVLTQRVTQNFPNYFTPTAATVAFSNYVYPTDTVPGGTTASCDAAPQPVANWVTPERLTFANTISGVEVAVFSRDGRDGQEVPAVKCIASDVAFGGSHTVSGIVSAMTVSTRSDPNPVVIYRCPDLTISTLQAGAFTYDAEVYPYYGDASAVNKSASNGALVQGLFTTRHFWHATGNPLVAYLCPQSNGSCTGAATTSCTASTTAAIAAAAPCSTGLAAVNAMKVAGNVDNAIIYVGTNAGTPPTMASTSSGGLTQAGGCLTYTRDPAVSKANAVIGFADGDAPNVDFVTNVSTGCARATDLTMKRAANNFVSGSSSFRLELILDSVALDNQSFTGSWPNREDEYWYNVTATNWAGSLAGGGFGERRMFRGVTVDNPGTLTTYAVLGSTFTTMGSGSVAPTPAGTADGQIVAFNKFLSKTDSLIGVGDTIARGMAIVQNVTEYIGASNAYSIAVSSDGNVNNTTNVILQYNTWAGAYANGRSNMFYDFSGSPRTTKLQQCLGNAYVTLATKGQQQSADATRAGNSGYEWGVGCAGEASVYLDTNSGGLGSGTAQAYPGLSANISATASPAANPFKFTTNAAVTYSGGTSGTYTAGAGNGNYLPLTGSPLKGVVPVGTLPFDLAGTARPATADSAGAYVAP